MTGFLKTAASALVVASFATGGVYAQSKSPGTDKTPQLKIEHIEPGEAMENVFDAIAKLRQATVLLLNQHEPGKKRDAAVQDAQEAMLLAQRALLQLPPEYRVVDSKIRAAKDWPVVMSRLDAASRELEDAVQVLKKRTAGPERDKAISTLRSAMNKVQDAMADLPAWTPGRTVGAGGERSSPK